MKNEKLYKKKILMSVGSLEMGGNEVFAMNILRNINKENFAVDFVTFSDKNMIFYDEIIGLKSDIWICATRRKSRLISLIDQSKQLYRILKKTHYDIIHCNSCSCLGIIRSALPAYMTRKIKIISHSHNVGENKNPIFDFISRKILISIISRISDYGFACSSEAGQSKYTKRFICSDRFKIINNAVDIEKYKYTESDRKTIRNHYSIEDTEVLLGCCGRLEYQKNYHFMLELLSKLNNSSEKKYKLLIIGEGILESELKEKAVHLRIDKDVIFAGRKNDANRYYNAMDAFILTSLFEGLPFVLVEAQINGLKCFVSNRVSDEVNISHTVSFIPLEIDHWIEEIEKYNYKRIDDNSVQLVIDKYDINNEMRIIENVYQML